MFARVCVRVCVHAYITDDLFNLFHSFFCFHKYCDSKNSTTYLVITAVFDAVWCGPVRTKKSGSHHHGIPLHICSYCIRCGVVWSHVHNKNQVRTITALALSSLAEAAHPYGIESFDRVLRPLWKGIRTHRGKGLAAFLKAIGFVIPLMDATYANYYTREVMVILIREFQVRRAKGRRREIYIPEETMRD